MSHPRIATKTSEVFSRTLTHPVPIFCAMALRDGGVVATRLFAFSAGLRVVEFFFETDG
jgi:hypothetical protein